jgi:hypothetical protein
MGLLRRIAAGVLRYLVRRAMRHVEKIHYV